jgi:maltose O-acetyltransferase
MKMKSFIQKIVRTLRGEVSTNTLIKNGLVVGKNFQRQGGVIIDPTHCWLITLGDNVTLASRVYILAHDASTKMHLGYTKIGRVTIGNNVFVGANSTILPGITIGNNVIIGSGSVVTKNIPDNYIVAGNPAKVISETSEYILKVRAMMDSGRPIYDQMWKIGSITNEQKKDMNEKLKDGMGFIE